MSSCWKIRAHRGRGERPPGESWRENVLPALLLLPTLGALWLLCPFLTSSYGQLPFAETQPVIVIDPGHGGAEQGVRGASGTREKEVVLRLAEQLALSLEDQFRVELTRTGDYQVDLPQRTGAANRYPAVAFLSLHTAASAAPQARGVYFYYHRPVASTDPTAAKTAETTEWAHLQDRHRERSQGLAQGMAHRWRERFPGDKVSVAGHPLPVLEGADMPAVLIEVGTLTHPADELRLNDPEHVEAVAAVLAQGVASFLQSGGSDP